MDRSAHGGADRTLPVVKREPEQNKYSCAMIEERDLAHPKQAQKALDVIMQDSRQEFV